jgi:BioD-like phosphotransacetylase family protein
MVFLFVGSTGDYAGHTLVTWAIAARLQERGYKVGFVKPFGTHPIQRDGLWTDHDALLFKKALNLPESLSQICPYPLSDEAWKEMGTLEILEDLKGYFRKLSSDRDVMLIMGSRHIFFDDATCPLPDTSFIPELEADLVLIHRYRQLSKSIYSILSVCSLLRESIRAILFNRVPHAEIQHLTEQVLPSLVQKGVPAIAALPEDPILSLRSLREIGETLDGEILCGGEDLEKPVASMTVGSADLTGGLLVFRRAYGKIVLLLPTVKAASNGAPVPRPVAGILLTGGKPPASQLLQAARKSGTPLIQVKEDTFAVLERLEQSPSILSSRDAPKLRRFMDLLDRDGSLDRLLDRLRLPS